MKHTTGSEDGVSLGGVLLVNRCRFASKWSDLGGFSGFGDLEPGCRFWCDVTLVCGTVKFESCSSLSASGVDAINFPIRFFGFDFGT